VTASPDQTSSTRLVISVSLDGQREEADHLVVEAPLEIRMGGVPLAVLMRTPGSDIELCRGFVLSESIVLGPHEIADIRLAEEDPERNRWEIVLSEGVEIDATRFQRNVYTSSSCGVCGKASIDAVRLTAAPAQRGPIVTAQQVSSLSDKLRNGQATFEMTGGLHGVALFDAECQLLALAEDIGRHNALDKVIGGLSRQMWPLSNTILMVSGRVSFEIVQKAAVAGIPMVCGVSAASSLAVELAEELGMTVIGFLRGSDFNIYTGAERVQG
jgi:FdhD protein